MAPGSSRVVLLGGLVSGGLTLYMIEAAVTRSPSLPGPPALGYLWACVFGALAGACFHVSIRAARDEPTRPEPERPSRIGAVLMGIHDIGYLIGILAGLLWLVQRLLGRAGPPNELQRDGLVLLAAIAVVVAGALVFAAIDRRARRHTGGGADSRPEV